MRTPPFYPVIVSALLAVGLAQVVIAVEGISTSYSDTVIPEISAGGEVELMGPGEQAGVYVRNIGKEKVTVELTAVIPARDQLRPGAEAIPDIGWVRVMPRDVSIAPGATAPCRVFLMLPADASLKGKTFQLMILAQSKPTASQDGVGLSAALLSPLRFQIEP